MNTKRVLVVDDEQDIVEIISYNLSKENFDVLQAYSGNEGIRMAKQFHPDLIIMDIRMPVLSGIEACKLLKEDEETKNIPVLFLTADSDEKTTFSALQSGGFSIINKPIRMSVLTAMIKDVLHSEINNSTA